MVQVLLSRGQVGVTQDPLDVGQRHPRIAGHPIGSRMPEIMKRPIRSQPIVGADEHPAGCVIGQRAVRPR